MIKKWVHVIAQIWTILMLLVVLCQMNESFEARCKLRGLNRAWETAKQYSTIQDQAFHAQARVWMDLNHCKQTWNW